MTHQHILNSVCNVFNITIEEITSQSTIKHTRVARALYAHLCHWYGLNMSNCMATIGRVKSTYHCSFKKQWEKWQDDYIAEKRAVLSILKNTKVLPKKLPKQRTKSYITTYTPEEELRMEEMKTLALQWGRIRHKPVEERIVNNPNAYIHN